MLTVKLGGWNNLVLVTPPQNRQTRLAERAVRRRCK